MDGEIEAGCTHARHRLVPDQGHSRAVKPAIARRVEMN